VETRQRSKDARAEAVLRGRHPICVQNQSSFLPSRQTLSVLSGVSQGVTGVCHRGVRQGTVG